MPVHKKARTSAVPNSRAVARQIDAIIKKAGGWRGATVSRLRAVIKQADPSVVEEVKWKKPSNPLGVPVWSHDGMLCVADTLKNAVRLTFPKGARLKDPKTLFNARLDSNTVRAVDFRETDVINAPALTALVRQAVALNGAKRDR
jgi:hypothetical protein